MRVAMHCFGLVPVGSAVGGARVISHVFGGVAAAALPQPAARYFIRRFHTFGGVGQRTGGVGSGACHNSLCLLLRHEPGVQKKSQKT
jgi:hypothetical protein